MQAPVFMPHTSVERLWAGKPQQNYEVFAKEQAGNPQNVHHLCHC